MLVAIKISYKEIDGSGLDSRLLSMYQIHTHISSAFSPKSAFRFDAHVWNCPLALMERLLADSIGCCASPAAGSRDARASFSVVQTATWFLSTTLFTNTNCTCNDGTELQCSATCMFSLTKLLEHIAYFARRYLYAFLRMNTHFHNVHFMVTLALELLWIIHYTHFAFNSSNVAWLVNPITNLPSTPSNVTWFGF